jgi:hypothetical protein
MASASLLLMAGGAVRERGDHEAGRPYTVSPVVTAGSRGAAARRLVVRFQSAIRHDDRDRSLALVGHTTPTALAQARVDLANFRQLGLERFTARYLGPEGSPGGRAWTGDVEFSWTMPGITAQPVSMQVSMRFVVRGSRTYIASVGRDDDNRLPLWATGPLTVRRDEGVTVVAIGRRRAIRTMALSRRAVADVRAVVHSYDGRLLVVAPATRGQFDGLLGVRAGKYRRIAALTTTLDGSVGPQAAVAVMLNPRVIGPLGPVALQVVLSHEVTHVATGAVTSRTPPWLTEGFADYVAFAGVGLPPGVIARQFLAFVRQNGPPVQLPNSRSFGVRATGLGRAYEASWLVCRLIAARFGQTGLVRLYDRAGRLGIGVALRQVLHTDRRGLTTWWRAYLELLADA